MTPTVKSMFVEAGIIPKLLALSSKYCNDVCWIIPIIADDGSPSDIKACIDAGAHRFLLKFITTKTFGRDIESPCWAMIDLITLSDSDGLYRLVTSPLFFKAFDSCFESLPDFIMPALERLLDYGQRLGQLQTGSSFGLELPCGTAPNNPFLDYVYAKCSELVDDAGFPFDPSHAELAKILKYVGNGHRPHRPC